MALKDLLSGLSRLSLSHHSSVTSPHSSTTADFALGLAHSPSSDLLAVTSWDSRLLLFSASSLTQSDSRAGPASDALTKPRFGPHHPHNLYAASLSAGPLLWDVRTPGGPASTFSTESVRTHGVDFLSLDVAADERLLAAGTSATKDGDAFVAFWDSRQPGAGFVGVYEEAHSEDVTALAFHTSDKSALLSGASDGLVCRFDLSAACEDDALLLTLNAERSVARVGWGKGEEVACVSDMDTFHAWTAEGDVRMEVTELPEGWKYVVDVVDECLLLLGDHEGGLGLWEAGDESVAVRMEGGHKDTVRCVVVMPGGMLVTGGEDGRLCCWKESKKPGKRKAEETKVEENGKGDEKGKRKKAKV